MPRGTLGNSVYSKPFQQSTFTSNPHFDKAVGFFRMLYNVDVHNVASSVNESICEISNIFRMFNYTTMEIKWIPCFIDYGKRLEKEMCLFQMGSDDGDKSLWKFI